MESSSQQTLQANSVDNNEISNTADAHIAETISKTETVGDSKNATSEQPSKPKAQTGADRKKHFLDNLRSIQDSEKPLQKNRKTNSNWDKRTQDSSYAKKERTEPRKPKKVAALYLSYCGTGYQGMQANPNAKTIEGDLFTALCKAGAVSEDNSSDQKKIQLQRAARTDKGVHAAGQIVSLKMIVEDEKIIEKINAELPEQIRVWGFSRVIRSFNPKTLCDSRMYEYLVPTYAFMPSDQMIKDMAKTISLEERQKTFYVKRRAGDSNEDSDNEAANANIEAMERHIKEAKKKRESFRMDSELHAQIKSTFEKYVGTHDFLNFTVTKGTTGKNSPRNIKSIVVSKPLIIGDGEWLSVKIHGQSFMLHQIRKMIGLAIVLARSKTPSSIIEKIYKSKRINIPKAPGFGLLLERPLFDAYNTRLEKLPNNTTEIREKIDFEPFESQMNQFKSSFIYNKIISEEIDTGYFNSWTEMCDAFPEQYPYLNPEGEIPESALI